MIVRAFGVSLLVATLVACNGDTAGGGGSDGCSNNADCVAGQVCQPSGECATVCSSDNQCDNGQICENDICVVGTRDNAPTITAVRGNGSPACTGGVSGTHCIFDGIIVEGQHLAGAELAWAGGSSTGGLLTILSSTDTAIEAALPTDVVADESYTLTVANAVGSDQTGVQLLEGEPGPDLTANELVARLNTATDPLAYGILPTGDWLATAAPFGAAGGSGR